MTTSNDPKAVWTDEEVALAKSVLALHGQPIEGFVPERVPPEIEGFLKEATISQLREILLHLLRALTVANPKGRRGP